jgi:hypothetical protein
MIGICIGIGMQNGGFALSDPPGEINSPTIDTHWDGYGNITVHVAPFTWNGYGSDLQIKVTHNSVESISDAVDPSLLSVTISVDPTDADGTTQLSLYYRFAGFADWVFLDYHTVGNPGYVAGLTNFALDSWAGIGSPYQLTTSGFADVPGISAGYSVDIRVSQHATADLGTAVIGTAESYPSGFSLSSAYHGTNADIVLEWQFPNAPGWNQIGSITNPTPGNVSLSTISVDTWAGPPDDYTILFSGWADMGEDTPNAPVMIKLSQGATNTVYGPYNIGANSYPSSLALPSASNDNGSGPYIEASWSFQSDQASWATLASTSDPTL